MVTKTGREAFARRAIEDWAAQTYPLRELIIVADAPEAFVGLPKNATIVRAKRGVSLGAVRAQSVTAATGDVIAVWDDDDGHMPERLARQVEALDGADASMLRRVNLECICGHTVYSAQRAWEPTLVARRSTLPPYQDLAHGEDTALIDDLRARGAVIKEIDEPELYRYRFWGGNACSVDHWMEIFAMVGKHNCWKCASDRGLVEPERADTFVDLARRIEESSSESALARIVSAVDVFRVQSIVNSTQAAQRAKLAVLLAAAYAKYGDSAVAQVWALRALQGAPRTDALCMLGEIAAADLDFAAALSWYAAACATPSEADACAKQLTTRREARRKELRTFARPFRPVAYRQMPVREHVLAVMSCAGRGKYLAKTVSSLVRAGLVRWDGPKILVHDGPMDEDANNIAAALAQAGWAVQASHEMLGQAQTFLQVLATTSEVPGFQMLTMFEDDVQLVRNGLDYIRRTEFDGDLALVSWFTTQNKLSPIEQPFLHISAAVNFTPTNAAITLPAETARAVLDRYYPSNQAITLPADTAHAILSSGKLAAWPEKHGADRIFWEVPGTPCAVHYPSLAQHVGGDDSRVGNSGSRISPTFPGEDFDALSLI